MAMTTATYGPNDTEYPGRQRRALLTSGAGSGAEALAGLGAITLAILGLAGVLPFVISSIAAIAVGGALLLEALALAGSLAEEVRAQAIPAGRRAASGAGAGLSAEALGGAAGVTLGLLALVGVAPWTLLAVAAALVFGGTTRVPRNGDFPHISTRSRRRSLGCAPRKETYPAFVARLASDADPAPIDAGNYCSAGLGGGSIQPGPVDEQVLTGGEPRAASQASAQAVRASGGAMALAGLATLALGVIALASMDAPVVMHTLVLVSFLVAGGASLLAGSSTLGRVADALR